MPESFALGELAIPHLHDPSNVHDSLFCYYNPIWELLQDLDVPFATHEYMGLRGNSFGHDRFTSFVEWHATVHTFEAMGAMLSMIVHGVFERYPKLRVSYMEAGCGWAPSAGIRSGSPVIVTHHHGPGAFDPCVTLFIRHANRYR